MKVALHFPTYVEILHFLLVNSKCFETIKALKINPWFTTSESITSFMKRFQPETFNAQNIYCHCFDFFTSAKCIRFPTFYIEEKDDIFIEQIKQILPKVTSLSLYEQDENLDSLFVKNAMLFTTIQSIDLLIMDVIFWEGKYNSREGVVCINGFLNNNRLNSHINDCYANECVVNGDQGTEIITTEKETWFIPSCVKKLTLESCIFYGEYTSFPIDLSFLEELELFLLVNFKCNISLPLLKKLTFINCKQCVFENKQQQLVFDNLENIVLETCSFCCLNIGAPKTKYIRLIGCDNITCCNSVEYLNDIVLGYCVSCKLPYISLEHTTTSFEECEDITFGNENQKSPLEFLSISTEQFNQIISDVLYLPLTIDKAELLEYPKTIFRMRKFSTKNECVVMNGNTITFNKQPESRCAIGLFSQNFFTTNNEHMKMKIWKEGKIVTIPSCVPYFELDIIGYNLISIGLVNVDEYEWIFDRHIGWDIGSIGFHADDGCLFDGNGYGKEYGNSFNVSTEDRNIVGCGFNSIRQEVIAAAFAFSACTTVKVNYGDNPFVYNLYQEVKESEIKVI
ncbi:B30.2/SPRY domain-containing protein [Entamoeba marina]